MNNAQGVIRRAGRAVAVATAAVAVAALVAPGAGAVGRKVGPPTIYVTVPAGTQCLVVVDPALPSRPGRITYAQRPDNGNTYEISELNVPAGVPRWYFAAGTHNCDLLTNTVGPLTSPASTPWRITIQG